MNKTSNDLINLYEKFISELNQFNIDQLTEGMTSQEVAELRSKVKSFSIPSMNSKLLAKEKAIREIEQPHSTKAVNYPELNNLSFLTKQEITKLDKLLEFQTKGKTIYHFGVVTTKPSVANKIREELLKLGILEERWVLTCDYCSSSEISEPLTDEEKEEFIRLFNAYKKQASFEIEHKINNQLHDNCLNCSESFDIDEASILSWNKQIVLVK